MKINLNMKARYVQFTKSYSGLDTYFSVVQEVGCRLQDAEGDHAGSGADHEVVGVGVAGVLLSLRPDCPRQQCVPLLDFEI